MTPPAVCAIIPAHNAERFVREAIESVLAQSIPVELIVVNDGSTDATASIIDSYGRDVRAIHQERRGLGGARNRGIQASRANWIAFLDADDRWMPDKLEYQTAVLAARSDVDMVFGHCVEFSVPEGDCRWRVRTDPFPAYSACAALVRRALLDRVGAFSESGKLGEFIDWYARAQESGARSAMLDRVVFHRRVHDANMTRTSDGMREQYLDVIRGHLERQRLPK
ncbi:MAG: glycosyltransferase family A protein [Acidobacteriota bacterium]